MTFRSAAAFDSHATHITRPPADYRRVQDSIPRLFESTRDASAATGAAARVERRRNGIDRLVDSQRAGSELARHIGRRIGGKGGVGAIESDNA